MGAGHPISPSQLCYLHVDMMRRMNPKEGRKQFLEFCHLFLDKAGVRDPPRTPPQPRNGPQNPDTPPPL